MRLVWLLSILVTAVLGVSVQAPAKSAAGAEASAASRTYAPSFLGGRANKVRPRTIGVGAKGGWVKLRWRRWGRARAYAKGVYDIAGFAGQPGTGYRGPVSIRAYARKACGGGRYAYTKVLYRLRRPLAGKRVFREPFGTCN